MKSKYKEVILDNIELIKSWVRDGLYEKDIISKLDISIDTFYTYKKKYPEFRELLKRTKEIVDNDVVNFLFENTKGGIVKLKKPFKLKRKIFDDRGKIISEIEHVEYVDEEIYVKPDTLAQIYWLNNRQSDKWKNKPDGALENNQPVAVNIEIKDCRDNGGGK